MTTQATLTLYFIPSPYGLDWSSPTKLARDIVKNRFLHPKRFMGHVNIELKYNDNGKEVHILTGMVAAKLNAIPLILKEHVGLGIIFHSFPGRLETKDELIPELDGYAGAGNKKMNFCRFLINDSIAKRAEEYINEYRDKDLGRYYGLYNSALHGEGAGCSGFGASFLDVCGIMTDHHKENWANCVKVPHKLIGEPITKNKVNFFKLLFTDQKWAKESEDHHEIFFWDPDLMYQDTQKRLANPDGSFEVIKIKNMTGTQFDMRQTEVPTGSIFKKFNDNGEVCSFLPEVEINTNLHKYN